MTQTFRYEAWKAANPSDSFSWFDYAHCALRDRRIAGDFPFALARLVWPIFTERGGLVFLADQYSEQRVLAFLGQGIVGQELEYWMNLFSVDGFLSAVESSTPEDQRKFAEVLAESWKSKLAIEFPGRSFAVEITEDDDVGDMCLSIVQVT